MADDEAVSGATLEQEPVLFDETIAYCWVDEDGARVSPIHKKMSAALAFIDDWSARKDRILARAAEAEREYEDHRARMQAEGQVEQPYMLRSFERDMEKVNAAKEKLTRTGKEPVALRRLITRTIVEDPTDAEENMAKAAIEAEFGASS